jgi:hypothetical protein
LVKIPKAIAKRVQKIIREIVSGCMTPPEGQGLSVTRKFAPLSRPITSLPVPFLNGMSREHPPRAEYTTVKVKSSKFKIQN